MTRETKIGLLVGLAFIIIVGILLSEPLSHATELPPAPLTKVAGDVRNGNGLPASANPPRVTPTPVVALDGPVPTAQEVRRAPGVSDVRIGASDHGAQPHRLVIDDAASHETPARTHDGSPPVVSPGETRGPSHPVLVDDGGAGPLHIGGGARDPRIGNGGELPEQLVPANLHGGSLAETPREGMARRETAERTNNDAAPVAMKTYEAAAGDTLSKLAGRFLGSNTKATRQAIVDANPSLKDAPDKVIAGQTYNIPVPAKPATPTRVADVAAPAHPAETPASGGSASGSHAAGASAGTVAASAEHWYVVQPGDNLTRIATEQLGNPKAMAAIKELNKDVLKGGDVVFPNMKLRLPAAPLASAS